MAMQVCEYPKCKKITLMSLCEEHRAEDFEEDEEPSFMVVETFREVDIDHPSAPPKKKETPMGTPTHLCKEIVRTGTRCTTGRAKGSDYCQRHIEKRAKDQAKGQTPAAQLPAKRAKAPIVLAEPIQVNGNGHGLSRGVLELTEAIGEYEHGLSVLREAKEILSRR